MGLTRVFRARNSRLSGGVFWNTANTDGTEFGRPASKKFFQIFSRPFNLLRPKRMPGLIQQIDDLQHPFVGLLAPIHEKLDIIAAWHLIPLQLILDPP